MNGKQQIERHVPHVRSRREMLFSTAMVHNELLSLSSPYFENKNLH